MSGRLQILLAGDVNLMGVGDPAVPFAAVAPQLRAADFCFANLECCLYDDPLGLQANGYHAPTDAGSEALRLSGIGGLGLANNVNHGHEPILSSLATLSRLGLPVTGAGRNIREARAPLVVQRQGRRIGILQRTAIYWPDEQEATQERPGVAVIAAHTAYRHPPLRVRRPGLPPANRPGMPAVVETWAEPHALELVTAELRALRREVDVLVASFHWGLFDEVLGYMRDYAHAAIEAGADLVVGHGPHDHVLPIERHAGRTIFYNLGALSFQHGPAGKRFHDWLGLLARLDWDEAGPRVSFRLVRQSGDMRIRFVAPDAEREAMDLLQRESAALGVSLVVAGEDVEVVAAG